MDIKKDAKKEISINDLELHTKKIMKKVQKFLSEFGNYFITVIEQNKRVSIPCEYASGLIGCRSISLREYKNNESGICQTINFDCSIKENCIARKNTSTS